MKEIVYVDVDPAIIVKTHSVLSTEGYSFIALSFDEFMSEKEILDTVDIFIFDIDTRWKEKCIESVIAKNWSNTEVFFLLTSTDPATRVNLFGFGIRDYIIKPFHENELVRKILTTSTSKIRDDKIILSGENYYFNLINDNFEYNGKKMELTKKEIQLLIYLVKNKNNVISIEMINENCFNQPFPDNTVRSIVKVIRKKSEKGIIQTQRGVGYVFIEN